MWLDTPIHMTPTQQSARLTCLATLLFLAMLVLVAPVTISSRLREITVFARRWGSLKRDFEEFWYSLAQDLLTFILMLINTLLLPECICRMSRIARLHRHSLAEITELHFNFIFLMIITMLIPLLGLTSLRSLMLCATKGIRAPISELVPTGIFALRYI